MQDTPLELGEQNQEKADGPAKGQEDAQGCLGIKVGCEHGCGSRGREESWEGVCPSFSICKMGTVTNDACLRDDGVYLTILCH